LAGKSAGEAVAFGLGFALGRVLDPAGTALEQQAWKDALAVDSGLGRAFDPQTAAAIVAETVDQLSWGEGEAAQTGMTTERFGLLVKEVYAAPGLGELFPMWRRGTITDAEFLHGLRKAKLPTEWDKGLTDLRDERLDPAIIATSIQRGIMHDPGVLPVGPPSAVGKVPPMPVVALDTLKEAAASGMNEERLAVLARIVGLPASPDLAARMVFRAIIDRVDFDRAVSEGNTRNEWAPFLFEGFREILTAHDYVELRLRGWIDDPAMYAGTGLHGMSKTDTDLLFKVLGRPITTHEVTTGKARGGTYNGPIGSIPTPYLKAMEESNLRPEWYDLHYANRYTYPSAFVIRSLAQTGELAPADVKQTLLDIGWSPDFAAKVTTAWTGGTKGTANKHVTSAETGLFTVLRKAYVNDEATEAQAAPILTELAIPEADHARIFALWGHERALVRSSLTAVQIKKAIGQPGKDQAWALARLKELGYTDADAATFLAE
jgi:hypothetical protein